MNNLTDHFGLTAVPFRKIPPKDAFSSLDLRTVIRRLRGFELLGGIALCVGEAGAGKTYAVEAWTHALDPSTTTVKWIDDPGTTSFSFFRRFARTVGLPSLHNTEAMASQLLDALYAHYRDHETHLIVVVDEGQHLPAEVLEQIRRLTNVARSQVAPLSFVLVGHREFLSPFAKDQLVAVRRRLSAVATVAGLSREELDRYVAHHLDRAGGQRTIFDREAIEVLWSASCGLPRMLNNLALHSMLAAQDEDATEVNATHVHRIRSEQDSL